MKLLHSLSVIALTFTGVYTFKKYCKGSNCPNELLNDDTALLRDKIVIVTGANSGIGFQASQQFVRMGASKVIFACRSEMKAKEAIEQLDPVYRDSCEYLHLDLSSLDSVRQFVKEFEDKYQNVHLLVNNAGIMMNPHSVTEDGFELRFQINHLSHYLLTILLLENLKRNRARVVTLSSRAHERGKIHFEDFENEAKSRSVRDLYRQSKLCNLLFAKELAKRYGDEITSVSLHPGVVDTELLSELYPKWLYSLARPIRWIILKNTWEGAQTTIYASVVNLDQTGIPNGSYLSDCRVKVSANPLVYDEQLQNQLWEVSNKLVNK
jgi:NAD(P)-dependent dehydrogenase (short-subunit alcohol dehydrogenase family)